MAVCPTNFTIQNDCCQDEDANVKHLNIKTTAAIGGNTTIGGTLDVAGTPLTIVNKLKTDTGPLIIKTNSQLTTDSSSIHLYANATGLGANSTSVVIMASNKVFLGTRSIPGQEAYGDNSVMLQDGGGRTLVFFGGTTGSAQWPEIANADPNDASTQTAVNAVIAALMGYNLLQQ